MNKQASSPNLSEKEKDFIKRQIEAKKIADEQAQLDHDIKKAENERKKKQDFEDLLQGKKSNSEKNLQELFTDFYATAKGPS